MAARKPIDWERVEADYCAGIKSIREIGRECGVTDAGIRDRAKKQGWERSLSARVAVRAEKLLRSNELRTELRTAREASEREVVEASAQAIVNVKLGHRKSIQRHRNLVEALTAELEDQTGNREVFEQLGELMRSPDDRGADKLNDLYKKIIATPQRIDSMKKLVETLKHLIYLEREAFDIVPAPTPQDNALQSLARAIQGNTLPIVHDDPVDDEDE